MTESQTVQTEGTGERRMRISLTWVLVVLTIPAAVLVFLYGMGAVMGMAGCTGDVCADKGPGEFWFGILFYGAPVVPVVTIAVSILTSRMRYGVLVPVIGLALLAIDFAVLALTF
ncbi:MULTISPECIES: hypothetical protein [Actinomycetes]|jgi:hypothetical protein|uniref:Uncharacterized protein n=4 Tax=Mycolicibacterium fortuitum TaxID=1766 RepID=A0A0N9XZ63_MYCFO|nr:MULTISPECIES: hypothetical protein [Actinomycetes]AIY45694.1 hypothetical protein G155_09135 [Mycobacterium sp. VKM Ac-1817D]CRL80044.1 hypothetical protein CPGR_03240 [Mycolicibacter nonchromogenicus]ALI25674.1 hypothetical protein XA26_18270 [Mycolicibacterium fortuitum]AMD54402.1 hypothetical protein ATO49_08675 [Mycolicibacterium fortuitum subsp. fortuitum DSM 46621 = ATCC 6841 = JCM 6387]EJZ13065.1 hypothetical protein MFORT_16374 [Mycolicibacterium fortuitum subsp. fortuitum DSM 46621